MPGSSIWEDRRERLGLDRLVDTTLLRIARLRAGLLTLVGQQLVLMGTFFVLPVYLQVVLGLRRVRDRQTAPAPLGRDAGRRTLGPKIAGRRSPRTVAQIGLVAISIGAVVMMATLDVNLNETGFKISLVLFGIGAGLLASQLGNVIMSSVDPVEDERDRRASGDRAEPRGIDRHRVHRRRSDRRPDNGFNYRDRGQPAASSNVRQTIAANTEEGIDIVPVGQVEQIAAEEGLPPHQAKAVADDYGDAELDALRVSLGAVAVAALLTLWFTRNLPRSAVAPTAAKEPAEATASA